MHHNLNPPPAGAVSFPNMTPGFDLFPLLFPPPPPGNILDNEELLTTLEGAKSKAVELAEKLAVAKTTAQEIDEARVRYSPVAARGAALFFCMAGLASINNMYEYSLAAFLGVFNQVKV